MHSPLQTSIRLLQVLDSSEGDRIQCTKQTADLERPSVPNIYSTLLHLVQPYHHLRGPLPDLAGLTLEEHAYLLLFAYCSPDLDIGDPNGGTKGNPND